MPLSFALAPATLFLRGEEGARLGGTAIAAYGRDVNGIVFNLGLTGATSSSPSNPSVQLDLATDSFHSLSDRLTIFAGALFKKASELTCAFSLDQGLAFRVRPHVVLDIGIVERGLTDGPSLELLLGLTVNLGWPGGRANMLVRRDHVLDVKTGEPVFVVPLDGISTASSSTTLRTPGTY